MAFGTNKLLSRMQTIFQETNLLRNQTKKFKLEDYDRQATLA